MWFNQKNMYGESAASQCTACALIFDVAVDIPTKI